MSGNYSSYGSGNGSEDGDDEPKGWVDVSYGQQDEDEIKSPFGAAERVCPANRRLDTIHFLKDGRCHSFPYAGREGEILTEGNTRLEMYFRWLHFIVRMTVTGERLDILLAAYAMHRLAAVEAGKPYESRKLSGVVVKDFVREVLTPEELEELLVGSGG